MGACCSAEAGLGLPPRLDAVVPRPWERRLDRMLGVPAGAIQPLDEMKLRVRARVKARGTLGTVLVSFASYDGAGGLSPVAWAEVAPLSGLSGAELPALGPGLALCGAAFVYDPSAPGGSVFDHERILVVARSGEPDGARARPAVSSRWARRPFTGWR